jgi:hypothetical protein
MKIEKNDKQNKVEKIQKNYNQNSFFVMKQTPKREPKF